MLMMLKEHHIRAQCLFSLVQHSYNARGIGPVRLWGTALTMRKGHERYRPTFLACATANRVIEGNLVQTVHEGANPTFVAEGVFSRQRGVEKYETPVLHSYAFDDGNSRGLILVNLDTQEPRPVEVRFEGEVAAPARSWILTADQIAASNEFEQPEPQVQVAESQLAGFRSGTRVTVPPFSMIALRWQLR
jgi:alpha-L-arabinofuranosidase